jgi:hypothetical protein
MASSAVWGAFEAPAGAVPNNLASFSLATWASLAASSGDS